MTDFEKILCTSAVTISGGLLLYILSQLLSKLFIEPTYELKKVIGEVRFNLSFHAAIIHTSISRTPERSDKAYEAIMKSHCDLLAKMNAIPFYSTISKWSFSFLPTKEKIKASSVDLRALSTYLHETDTNIHPKASNSLDAIRSRVTKIEKNLNLEPGE